MIEVKNITKKLGDKSIIKNFDLNIEESDFVAICGESGKGKTTLLNILGLLEKVDSGDVIIDQIKNPNNKEIQHMQRKKFGYLFQNFALIENETVANNLNISLKYQKRVDKKKEISTALKQVGLEGYERKKVFQLSGGEQQRVALARIILKECEVVFADEPTGNLDPKNRDLVFDILKDLNLQGKTIIYVTHDIELARRANKCIKL
ncbi:putative bacteriocin export ABC transporter [Pontibacillus litoralis]|uniref:Bacteriocin ABC transporter ATP-binding protein n=1 Tax=Pontibacillus litoralis JSM 072002 TaxID=1385512 RepID=A0A0A5HUJ2_9BACI|nr:putative bacteriocin export ABC transporter [Pontibacillus litoralis]KGX87307.1 bacteriocin ABC transporter ATP-binding protein [Pontibacillus litoralis JSM 072002]